MRICAPAALAALALAVPAGAHDLWLEPADFTVRAGAPFGVRAMIGKAGAADLWGASRDLVTALESVGAEGATDQTARLGPAVSLVALKIDRPGAHWLALETARASSELPAWTFNAYIVEEGLAPAIERRQARHEETLPGRESYHRCIKTLVRAGGTPTDEPPPGDAETITAPLGQRLEIVPEADPSALADGAPLPVRVFYEGRPLAGAMVRPGRLDRREAAAPAITDAEGRAALAVPHEGAWVLGVVWTAPLEGGGAADFDTTFASLAFGFTGGS